LEVENYLLNKFNNTIPRLQKIPSSFSKRSSSQTKKPVSKIDKFKKKFGFNSSLVNEKSTTTD